MRPKVQLTTVSKIRPWNSLKTRITCATLLIFLMSLWSLSFYVSQMLRKDIEHVLGEQQFSMATYMAGQANQELDERLKALETIAKKITPDMMRNPASIQILLEQEKLLQSLFNGGILVGGPDGTAIADVPISTTRIGVNFMYIDSVAVALKEGKSTISRPMMGIKLLAPVFGMTAPIRDPHGRIIGALAGVTHLGKPNFLEQISQDRNGQNGTYMLVATKERMIVTATDKKRAMEILPAPGINPIIDRFIQGYEGSAIAFNPQGVEMLASVKQIPVANWYIGVALPTHAAFAPIRAMQQRMLLATILLTLVAGCLTWWMLRRQLAPMLAAVKALSHLSDTDQPFPPLLITHADEVGQLITAFNRQMTAMTQRKIALQESEGRFTDVLESVGLIGLMLDLEGRITLCNDQLLKLTGWRREEVLDKNWFEYFLPAELRSHLKVAIFQKCLATGDMPQHYENEIITRQGERRLIAWINITITAGNTREN